MAFNDSDRPGMRQLMAAFKGNKTAQSELMSWALPKLSDTVRDAYDEIERRKREQWDAEAAREIAMSGDVTPQQSIGAYQSINAAIIRVLALTPMLLMAQEENVEDLNNMWSDAVYELLVTIHNPNIRYAIIGGMRPEIREDVDDYLLTYGHEIWGSALALTSDEEITASEFPENTEQIIRQLGEQFETARGE